MGYPLPLQVTVIWHPESDKTCRPHAEKIIRRSIATPISRWSPELAFRCSFAAPERTRANRSSRLPRFRRRPGRTISVSSC
jgi:hypothetical protein